MVAPHDVDKRKSDERKKRQQKKAAARVVYPLAETKSERRDGDNRPDEAATKECDEQFAIRQQTRAWPEGVGEVRHNRQPDARHDKDGEDPEVPSNHEAHKLAPGELGPLVDTPFERQHATDIDDDHSQRQIEGDNRQQPEEELLVAELRSRPDPHRPDDEDYLREHQVCEAEFLWEDGAPLLDALFLAQDLSQRARSFRIFCHLDLP